MKRYIASAFLLTGWLFIFGCYTQSPRPGAHDYSIQLKMQSAHHWDVLAEDVAKQIKTAMANLDALTQPVYVEPACNAPSSPCQPHGESPFGQGFRDLLMTHLVTLGIPTIEEIEDGAWIVTNKVQVVWHKDERSARRYPKGVISGVAATLAGAIMVIRDAYENGSPRAETAALGLGALAGAVWYDATDGSLIKKVPHSEVIITTSIKDHNSYLMRKTDVYYVNDLDYWHYATPPPAQLIEIRDS